jgi:hypothetical protein
MRSHHRSTPCLLLLAAVLVPASAALAQQRPAPAPAGGDEGRERNLQAYVELLRADIRAQKIAVITEVMGFTEEEDDAFWPIYREYDLELNRLNDERVRLIDTYAAAFRGLTDAVADDIVTRALDLESRRTALKQKYYARLKGALSPTTAARFLQVENQLLLLIDLQIAAALPIAQ